MLSSALYQCIADLSGLASAEEYNSTEHACLSDKYVPVLKIKGGRDVVPREDESALAEAVARQPIAAAIDASRSTFHYYKSGVYSDSLCSNTKLDHSVLVVGYGTMEGEDYWIVKNSWGKFSKIVYYTGVHVCTCRSTWGTRSQQEN